VLFLVGALFLFFSKYDAEVAKEREEAAKITGHSRSFVTAFAASFGVVFLGEWGDITQITTANYAAHYQSPISVAIGAVLALWTAAAVAVIAGTRLLRIIPATLLQRIAGVILLIFSAVSAYSALQG
jgi:putative Ca2+/H+ antiporter (TMEM165/GDT1 family)